VVKAHPPNEPISSEQEPSVSAVRFIEVLRPGLMQAQQPPLLVERLNNRMSNESVLERIKRMQEAALNQER